MKVLLSWMQEFAPIEGDPHELAATLTDIGLVVDDVSAVGTSWDGIVVAKVLALRPHPKADRIQLVDVDAGDGGPLQICCGAFNMAVGDLVPLATLGTVMPGGLEIARRQMRGEWSNGMLCSAAELEVAEDADGIHILDPGLTVGQPLVDALGTQTDVLFDIDVEGNRPDALSVAGVARDLAAKLQVPFTNREPVLAELDPPASERTSIEIRTPDFCQRFGARVLDNITVGRSPSWMAARLTAAGMRPINSIVDISNYVMLELGQPNHTYDLALVPDGHLGVRMGRDGERIITLDDVERTVTTDDGVIVNAADEPIGLAGVMGGASTEITDATTSVVVEAAVWDRMTIAHTSRRLGLRSEASTRFERGVDPYGVERALDRFAELAVEICGAKVSAGVVVAEGTHKTAAPVEVRTNRVNAILNTSLSTDEIARLLEPIGYTSEPVPGTDDRLTVSIPTWRPDSTLEIDVIEEVGRHHGYDKSRLRVPVPIQVGRLTPAQIGRRRIRRALLGAGFSEAMPMPFLAPDDLSRAGVDDSALTLANPLVAEESVLRTSLLPGLLKAVVRNQSHRSGPVALYELGRVYHPADGELPDEYDQVAAIESGFDPSAGRGATAAEAAVRALYRLAAELGLTNLAIANAEVPGLHPTRGATVQFRGRVIGVVGEVDPRVLDNYEIDGRAAWFELQVDPMLAALGSVATYRPISLYPSSDIDLAFIVDDEVPATLVARTLSKAGGDLLQSVELFDVFRSEQLGEGRRSIAYRLRLQAADRTLTDAEVAEVRQRCIDAVAKSNGGQLR